MIATHRGNVTADEMLQARFGIAAPAFAKIQVCFLRLYPPS
jgi:hypothetical protein